MEQCVTLACLLEVTAPKPGNVHRGADFEDLCFADFVVSSVAVGPSIASASREGVGLAVLEAVRATRNLVQTNTNLGTILLLAPLARVPRDRSLRDGVSDVLESLTSRDAELAYEAIQLAAPGGLGEVQEMDISGPPPEDLMVAMQLAAERDLVARQYVNRFQHVFEHVVPSLTTGLEQDWSLTTSIIQTHLRLMAAFPDSLIARKCGLDVAAESASRAQRVLESGVPASESYQTALADLDFWLRSDGHRRNPGTTADLIAAGIFVLLRDELIPWPV